MIKRALELIRVSTLGQADDSRASIPSQRVVNQQTAERYGLTIVRTFEMAGVSGAAVLLAPEMQEMIRTMQDPEIHGVITREFSRLMRPENFADYALLQSFVDSSTVLYLPEGPIDFSSDSGMILGTVHATLGGIERKQMKRKIWNAKEVKRREGELANSKVVLPYGVSYPWAWTADAEKLREVFRLFLSGHTSYAQLSKRLGVTPSGLRGIMRNPIYTGVRVIDKKRDMTLAGLYPTKDGRQTDRRKVHRTPEEIIRKRIGELEPLISEDEWKRVQQIMDLKHANSWRVREAYDGRFHFNGYLKCPCGSLIWTKHHQRKNDYYVCRDRCGAKYMERRRLEHALNEIFAQRLTDKQFLRRHLLEPLMRTRQPKTNTALLKTQLTKLETKRARVLDAFFEGVIDTTERTKRLNDIDSESRQLNGLLSCERPVATPSLEVLCRAFAPFRNFDLLNREDKRILLAAIGPTIIAKDYQIEGLWFSIDGGSKDVRTDTDSLTTSRHYLKLGIAA